MVGPYSVQVTRMRPWLSATVLGAHGVPLVALSVVSAPASLQAVLESSWGRPAVPLTVPAAIVETLPGLATDLHATDWLGDFERCLAWAYLVSRAN